MSLRVLRYIFLCLTLFPGVCDATGGADAVEIPKTETTKANYSIGYQVGGDLRRQGVTIDPDLLIKGVEDAVAGRDPLLTHEQMRGVLVDLQKRTAQLREEKVKQEAAKNLSEGEAFLAENGKREGIVTLPGGLQYKVIREGSGKRPKVEDTVTVHYRGTLIDGTEFDNSFKRGEAAVFRTDHVIPAWKEALPLMKEGSKWQLFVPSRLGYGQLRNGVIGPNSALIFEIELVSIKGPKE